jgi:glycosyltransferase involved in cell wall biosynthesis
MTQAAVTILVCTFNDQQTIADSLQSALAQTAAPSRYCVLVVDDGSTDATKWILESYRERIGIVHMPANGGLAAACNAGLERVTTRWFVRLDTDDLLDADLLVSLLECQRATGADLVATDRWEQLPAGRRQLRRLSDPPRVGELIAAGTLLPTEAVRELGGYRPMFWEEFDLYMRLIETRRCKVARIPRPLYTYRIGVDDQMTSDAVSIASGWRQLRERWPAPVLARHGLADIEKVPGRVA